ncbi:MAG: ABC transporter substrate-binding protein, partial [Bacteroidota bacterium]
LNQKSLAPISFFNQNITFCNDGKKALINKGLSLRRKVFYFPPTPLLPFTTKFIFQEEYPSFEKISITMRLYLGLLIIFSLTTCQGKKENSENWAGLSSGKELTLEYAKGFQAFDYDDFVLVNIYRNTREAKDTIRYIFRRNQQAIPQAYRQLPQINIPIQKLVCLSSTFLEPILMLGEIDKIKGIDNQDHMTNTDILARLKNQEIQEVAKGGQLDQERILALDKPLIMDSGFGNSDELSQLNSLGVSTVMNIDWQETTPLGRVEWIKYIALFFGKEKEADSIFRHIRQEYLKVKEIAKQAKEKPRVILEVPFQGSWYVSGGNSYSAQMLRDAQADYPWDGDTSRGAIPLDLEAVYPEGRKADFWINLSSFKDKNSLLQLDKRFEEFKAFQENNLYNHNRISNEKGGNDYWNSGVMNPHLVLSDLVKIFHPELLPTHQLVYYQKLKD